MLISCIAFLLHFLRELEGLLSRRPYLSIIIGIYEEPMTPGQCNMVVERLGDYLVEQGF
ncbi:Os01g0191150 [Oryza sativa Japonica Group]|uniref:Os01g0191150 protein n=1 Tax=Oryza sativa subsp. japonica TaxID=39947 RepID=A0A0P0UZ97_ORYSJ|nr:hypothetical protein EE612_000757 [Oryza sativa]BAS70820.1 Os01g0191150 [Oryza sativa Japonica Group]